GALATVELVDRPHRGRRSAALGDLTRPARVARLRELVGEPLPLGQEVRERRLVEPPKRLLVRGHADARSPRSPYPGPGGEATSGRPVPPALARQPRARSGSRGVGSSFGRGRTKTLGGEGSNVHGSGPPGEPGRQDPRGDRR